jgi:hypothetical protein
LVNNFIRKPTISILDCDGMQTVHMPNWCAPLEFLVTRPNDIVAF